MQSHSIKKKNGFTLVEVIVVGVLVAILGVGIISVLSWMMHDGKEANQKAHLQSEGSVIQEDLGRRTRESTKVLVTGGKIVSFVKGGVTTSTFKILGGQIQDNGLTYMVSGTPVLLDESVSFFASDTVAKTLQVFLVLKHDSVRFNLSTNALRCRN
jgi:prepilin-type N-terminal cleavage/methylation domain-containing protein